MFINRVFYRFIWNFMSLGISRQTKTARLLSRAVKILVNAV